MDRSTRVLLVDDDSDSLLVLSRALRQQGLAAEMDLASTAERAQILLEERSYAVAVIDLTLDSRQGPESGLALIKSVVALDPACRAIVLTGHRASEYGVAGLRAGAASFLEKPADISHLHALILDGVKQSELRRSYHALTEASRQNIASTLIGTSKAIRDVVEAVHYAAATRQPVLLGGETGTGKGLCARLIHQHSSQAIGKFVRYQPNFASADIVNSDLFGHVRGAYTGAERSRAGLIVAAQDGTLFLDEIGELPLQTQVALLGVLQERTVRPVGSDEETRVNVRLISASNVDLSSAVRNGSFREDLVHRIAHLSIVLPSLRSRIEDITLLTDHFLEVFRERDHLDVYECAAAATVRLESYDWPGNVRELEAVIEGAAYRAQFDGRSVIGENDIVIGKALYSDPSLDTFHRRVEAFKVQLVQAALTRNEGNQSRAARDLGLDRSTLRRIIARHEKVAQCALH